MAAMSNDPRVDTPESRTNGAVGRSEKMGTLIRTVVTSPEIKWAFEAQIRDKAHNDIVFVRERSLELKERAHNYRLDDIAFKADFESTIRAAIVIGTPQVIPQVIYGNEANAIDSSREIKYAHEVPPQMLALVLRTDADERLAILFALNSRVSAKVEFVAFQQALPPSTRDPTSRLGEHIAVDTQSRILAVAAQESRIMLYKLKPVSEVQKEAIVGNEFVEKQFHPISSSSLIEVEGFVHHMAFLHGPVDEPSMMILVLVVSVQDRLQIHTYEWDDSQGLPRLKHVTKRLLSPIQLVNPLFLIPLRLSPSFALVCEHKIAVFSDVRLGGYQTDEMDLFSGSGRDFNAAEDPGNSRGVPLYTAWARPHRHAGFSEKSHDGVYLCREDGLIRYVEFELNDPARPRFRTNTPLGHLRINANTAFTILQNQPSVEDIILVGGQMSNGGIYTVLARQDPCLRQVIPNWAPVIDFCSTKAEGNLYPTVFACTGRGRRHGAVTELQYGIQAQELSKYDSSDEWKQAWLLPANNGITLHGLFSSTTGSRLESLTIQFQEFIPSPSWTSFIDRDRPTICASRTRDGIYIQVTDLAVNVALEPADEDSKLVSLQREFGSFHATGASIAGNSSELAIIGMTSSKYLLLYSRLSIVNGRLESLNEMQLVLENEPTCVDIWPLKDASMIVVGTRADEILVFERRGAPFNLKIRHSFGKDSICESLMVIPTHPDRLNDCKIIAGLRSGLVLHMVFVTSGNDACLQVAQTFEMGTTAVKITPTFLSSPYNTATWPTSAAAVCEGKIFHIETIEAISPSASPIQRVWPIGSQGNGILQLPVKSWTQLEPWNQELIALVFPRLCYAISGSNFRLFTLKHECRQQIVPRCIPLGGTPRRVIYNSHHKALLVALEVNVMVDPIAYGRRPADDASLTFSALKFLKPNEVGIERDHPLGSAFDVPPNLPLDRSSFSAIVGRSGEKVRAMADWTISSVNENDVLAHPSGSAQEVSSPAEKSWQLLLVGTQRPPTSRERITPQVHDRGRVWMYSITSGHNDKPALEWRYNFDAEEPVSCVAGHDKTSFVYCAGSRLYCQRFEIADRVRPTDLIDIEIQSKAGRTITVEEPYVYVSTEEHSLRVYEVRDNRFYNVFNEPRARASYSHVLSVQDQVIFTSDLLGEVTILKRPSNATVSGDLSKVGEAKLSSMISSMQEASIVPSKPGQIRFSPVLASALDGSIYQISLIDPPMAQLLRFIQHYAKFDRRIRPFGAKHRVPLTGSGDFRSHSQVSWDNASSEGCRIDGDMLARVIQHFGQGSGLRELFTVAGEGDSNKWMEETLTQLAADAGIVATVTDGIFHAVGHYLSLVLQELS